MNATQLLQAILDGLATGALYALVALSFSLVWATVRTVDLALLQIIAVAGMVAYWVGSAGVVPALLASIAVSVALAVLSHYIAIRPTRAKGQIYPVIASLGLGLLILGAASLIFGVNLHTMPPLIPGGGLHIGSLYIAWTSSAVLCITFALLASAAIAMKVSKLGLAFRATAAEPQLAEAYGIGVRSVLLGSAASAGVGIGLAGPLGAVQGGSVSPFFGATMGLMGIVAMLLGGAGNPAGAVVGGLLVGIIQSVASQYLSGSMGEVASYSLLLLVMVARPSGLMKGSMA